MKRWPTPPTPPSDNIVCGGWGIEDWGLPKTTTSCKHGLGDCEECGTTDRRDRGHTTKGGVGTVGRLMKRR